MAVSIIVTFAFVLGEGITGFVSHSLALMSDAGHNFADTLALSLSWYGLRSARRPSTSERTFGHHRVGILAALVNALYLVLIAMLIFWEAISRFRACRWRIPKIMRPWASDKGLDSASAI